ncbi:MAG TPA: 5-methyltetrahydropteroyltriglutamate--homocysteine S-methyltransferase, partial [Steroidobacteraceae bacterium]|nr:5-methyltetrahydropteroyltriglutamate--homocysteine S-methyltransferase [Steroidobacteraceae bacterium]
HIGSLLRPPELRKARQEFDAGRLSPAELKDVEDRCIRDAVKLQEDVGLQPITDGEFRRTIYFGHFPDAVSGFTEMASALTFQDEHGKPMQYRTPVVTGRLKRHKGIATEEFKYVKSLTNRTPKVTLPSPCSQHYFRWRDGISEKAYPDVNVFIEDVAAVYREELAELASLGAKLVQLDDVSLPLLCDTTLRAGFAARGYDPDEWVGRYIEMVNQSIKDRPKGLQVSIHLCRGNNQGKWIGEGGYDYIADQMFNQLQVDFFCMEYDSPRAGSFEPLRFLPKNKAVVLGLISSKLAALENPDDLRARIDEAAKFVDLDRLALSPQCGFASTAPGNAVTTDDQRAKLKLTVDVAQKVWG